MQLKEILDLLSKTAQELGTAVPYICGGTPRDKVMGKTMNIEDIDITTGDNSIHILAKTMATKTAGQSSFKEMNDGHAQLIFPGIKLDFSTNYIEPGVVKMLSSVGMQNPSSMQQELYSRDFTCNALLMTLDLKKIIDPIGLGIQDIKKKVLRTCLPARITLGSDNRRIVRVVYMAAKLGFKVDDEIIKWVKQQPGKIVANGGQEYISKKINKAFEYNPDVSIKLLDEMGLWPYIPVSDKTAPYMSHNVGVL
jgi:tRNA nucleotidyltransferase/poly(A) polymerase